MIPEFGRLVWGRGKQPCSSCGKPTPALYRNPTTESRVPCCGTCYKRLRASIVSERRKNTIKRLSGWFLVVLAVALLVYLIIVVTKQQN